VKMKRNINKNGKDTKESLKTECKHNLSLRLGAIPPIDEFVNNYSSMILRNRKLQ